MQTRLVRLPAVAAELLRRVSRASIFRASIRAEERFCFRSFRGELRGFTWITLVDRMHAVHAELSVWKVLGGLLFIEEAVVATAHIKIRR